MGYLDYAGLQYLWGKLKEKFAPKSHSHDDRYYTEAEMDGKLNSKSNTNHTHDASTLINALGAGTAAPTDPDYVITQWVGGGTSNTTWVRRPMSSIWSYIKSKADSVYQPKGNYAASSHSHDDRYYTESEVNGKLGGKVDNTEAGADGLLSKLTTSWTATPTDNTYFIRQDTGGGDSFGRVKFSTIWNYIKGKTDGVYQPKGSYAASGHTHDDRYYTEAETNSKLDGKSNTGHTHDDRYYTETEIDTKLNGKAPNGHTHQYLSLYGARPANINFTKSTNGTGAMFHFVATSSTTTGNPPDDSSILQLNWDNNGGWDSQLALSTTAKPHVYYRNQQNGTWGNWSTLLDNLNYIDYAAKKEHTHTKAQITDFPASLKNPTALTIQTNGAIAATYDGSAAKTVNITKGNIGLGNVDNTADANKSVASAAKLTTARTVSGGSDITLSFNYDGSNNSTANIGFYSCKHSIDNTNNYPFHRFAKLDANKNAWVDNSMTFLISQDYSGGGYGICRLVYRSNADSSSASLAAEWLVRKGLSVDTVQVAIKTDKTNGAYCDAFYKSSGGYTSVVIRAIASGGRASLGRTWTLINSNETGGTTATDKKTSSECWKTIADAGNELHKQAYSSSAPAIDGGYVASAGLANTAASCTGNSASATKLTSSAGSATQPVYFKDGKPVAGTYTLGDASSKMVRTLSAQGNSGWTNKTTDDKYVPTMSFMAYWNGAYGGTSSNLQYCDRGRFGTIVTKGSGDYAAASHTHNYAGSGSAGGSATSAVKLDSSAGSNTQPVYFSGGKPVAIGYTIAKSVPADAKFTDTNTWRGIQNNLTSDSTDQSLSAAQGKALKTLVDGKAPASHKHTKSQITDFPTSMPASDVSAWAKAATKPSYTKAEVGLSNVDNTADKDKSVKYAASAGSASQLNGFTIQASTSDLTAGYSRLNNNVIYIVYE